MPKYPKLLSSPVELRAEIGRRMRLARQAQALSQAEAAHAVGVAITFYERMERGRAFPSVETLAAISRALRVSPDALIGRAPAPEPGDGYDRYRATPEQKQRRRLVAIERKLRAASPETLRAVARLLDTLDRAAQRD